MQTLEWLSQLNLLLRFFREAWTSAPDAARSRYVSSSDLVAESCIRGCRFANSNQLNGLHLQLRIVNSPHAIHSKGLNSLKNCDKFSGSGSALYLQAQPRLVCSPTIGIARDAPFKLKLSARWFKEPVRLWHPKQCTAPETPAIFEMISYGFL